MDSNSGRPVRATVLSAGAWSLDSHLPTLAADPRVELVGASSLRADIRAAIAARYRIDVVEDWQDCLAQQPDVVVVSSPPVAHVEQVTAALESGAHVLVEKPFALTAADADTMVTAAGLHDRALLVGYGWSSTPIFLRARQWVADGRIGGLEFVQSHLAVPIRDILAGGGDGGWGAAIASDPRTYSDPAVSGGGARAVSMSHQLGLVCWLADQRFAEVAAALWPSDGIESHVAATATLSGGTLVSLACGASHPVDTRPHWEFTLYGSQGQIELDTIAGILTCTDRDGVVRDTGAGASAAYDSGGPTTALVDTALGAAVPTGMSGDLAAHVVAVTEALAVSHMTGVRHPVGERGGALEQTEPSVEVGQVAKATPIGDPGHRP